MQSKIPGIPKARPRRYRDLGRRIHELLFCDPSSVSIYRVFEAERDRLSISKFSKFISRGVIMPTRRFH